MGNTGMNRQETKCHNIKSNGILTILFSMLLMGWGLDSVAMSVPHAHIAEENKGYVVLKKNISLSQQLKRINTIYEIKYDFDLNDPKGKKPIAIPKGCILKFEGGSIKNGTLNGNHTGIIAKDLMIFDAVTIKGTWNVPVITSKWFKCVKDNDLVQAFNLLSDEIQNTLTIEKRTEDYWVGRQVGGTLANPSGILNLKSNTRCIVNGTIRQRGHHSNYIHLFLLNKVENVVLEGSGTIYGEKKLHNYSGVTPILPTDEDYKKVTHENNHIITIQKCRNVTVSGLTLKDSTGDAIDILNLDENVDNHIVIENFTIDNCSRQGISAEGSDIEIKNGTISNINRTMPMSGIDIEISVSRNGRSANDITVQNVVITNCYTGFQSYTPATTPANIHDLKFRNVKCSNINRGFYIAEPIKNVSLVSCIFDIIPSLDTFTMNYSPSENFSAENCRFICDKEKCRETWGWPNIKSGDAGYSNKNTADYDFTMLRTGALYSEYNTKIKTRFKGCVVYSPYTNLIKRANKNTTIEDCVVTCHRLNVVTTSAAGIIKNSRIDIKGANRKWKLK